MGDPALLQRAAMQNSQARVAVSLCFICTTRRYHS